MAKVIIMAAKEDIGGDTQENTGLSVSFVKAKVNSRLSLYTNLVNSPRLRCICVIDEQSVPLPPHSLWLLCQSHLHIKTLIHKHFQ